MRPRLTHGIFRAPVLLALAALALIALAQWALGTPRL